MVASAISNSFVRFSNAVSSKIYGSLKSHGMQTAMKIMKAGCVAVVGATYYNFQGNVVLTGLVGIASYLVHQKVDGMFEDDLVRDFLRSDASSAPQNCIRTRHVKALSTLRHGFIKDQFDKLKQSYENLQFPSCRTIDWQFPLKSTNLAGLINYVRYQSVFYGEQTPYTKLTSSLMLQHKLVKNYRQDKNQNLFTCHLHYDGIPLQSGRGDTKTKAREAAAQATLDSDQFKQIMRQTQLPRFRFINALYAELKKQANPDAPPIDVEANAKEAFFKTFGFNAVA